MRQKEQQDFGRDANIWQKLLYIKKKSIIDN